ncbi:MAG: GGDEF domain-containing protein [Phycisphaerales bacterium]|nr:GGDEF domain-containing protein [Phycisphaerales bacterium]
MTTSKSDQCANTPRSRGFAPGGSKLPAAATSSTGLVPRGSLEWWLLLLVLLLIATTYLLGTAAAMYAFSSLKAQDRINQYYGVVTGLDSLRTNLEAAEAHHRGYLLTGSSLQQRLFLHDLTRAQITLKSMQLMMAGMPPPAGTFVAVDQQARLKIVSLLADRPTSHPNVNRNFQLATHKATASSVSGEDWRNAIDRLRGVYISKTDHERARARGRFIYTAIFVMAFAAFLTVLVGHGYIRMIRSVRQTRRLTIRLEHEATHDALTGLPNRAFFLEWVERHLAQVRREGSRAAVLFLDLDGFKQVNDQLGHRAGDDLLIAAAARLQLIVRDGDFVARLGGDEFAVLLPSIDDPDALATLVARIIEEFKQPLLPKIREAPSVSVSVGYSVYPDDGRTPTELLATADAAMYQDKQSRRSAATVARHTPH